jgi:L,D-transpeptidase catalytic domain
VTSHFSRRDFLKASSLAAGAFGLAPPLGLGSLQSTNLLRVATRWIGVYAEPDFRSARLDRLERDNLVTAYEQLLSDDGPPHNPYWYRLADGFAHSGYLQVVRWEPQIPLAGVRNGGELFEISVPFTRSYRQPDPAADPLYRLYYQSTAWVDQVLTGADGRTWYGLKDDLLKVKYFARAEHLRRVPPDELTPVSPDVPLAAKRIEVSLAHQELRAYEHDQLVLRTSIASGIPSDEPGENGVPTSTPKGRFYVDKKMPLRHMGDGHLTSNLDAYELPGVPWVSFFHYTGVAFHGTYWHNDFGRPQSHGCVNMRTEEAKWLYRWTLPVAKDDELLNIGHGTTVDVT